jgi:hypothetical protein
LAVKGKMMETRGEEDDGKRRERGDGRDEGTGGDAYRVEIAGETRRFVAELGVLPPVDLGDLDGHELNDAVQKGMQE